jgi:hypothetical protein
LYLAWETFLTRLDTATKLGLDVVVCCSFMLKRLLVDCYRMFIRFAI